MSIEQNKSILRRWIENGWNKGNLALVDELYTTDLVQYDPAKLEGREALKHYVGGFQAAMPDLHFSIEDLIAEGDKVVWRFTATGTQTGPLMGIPPTGKQATVTGTATFRLVDSRIAEVWVNFDALSMLQQMGVVPMPNA
jgi:steroid delta-isomerase-like uncharacterized protein